MPNKLEVRNMKVTLAGYNYIGHFRRGELKIILEAGGMGCYVNPKDEFNMFELFRVFDIDPEDGKMLESLTGKYCRVHFDGQGYPKMLQHLTNDNIIWKVG